MLFKDISYLELWWPLCSLDKNHLCNFGRMHHDEQFCENIVNLDQWFRRKCHVKVFLIWSSGDLPYRWGGTINAILVDGIMRNISMKLF